MARKSKKKDLGRSGPATVSPVDVAVAGDESGAAPTLNAPPEISAAKTAPEKPDSSKRPVADFKYQEGAVAFQLGVSARKFVPYRQELVEGRDWLKKGGRFWWTKAGLRTVLLDMGVPAAVVFPEEREVIKPTKLPDPGPWVKATVVAYKLTNDRVILCDIGGRRERVQINAAWRDLYRNGMAIEVQKAPSGYWRTIRPVRRGVFK